MKELKLVLNTIEIFVLTTHNATMSKYIIALFSLMVSVSLYGQSYITDLRNNNFEAFKKKVSVLDVDIKAEPILAKYLTSWSEEHVNKSVVEQLINFGVGINTTNPETGLTPLETIVEQDIDADLILVLLKSGAKLNPNNRSQNVIDAALANSNFRAAAYLIRSNNNLGVKEQLKIDSYYNDKVSIINDKPEFIKKVIASGRLNNTVMWDIAVAAKSINTISILSDLSITPEHKFDNSKAYDVQYLILEDNDLVKLLASKKYDFNSIIDIEHIDGIDSQRLIDIINLGFRIVIDKESDNKDLLNDLYRQSVSNNYKAITEWLEICGMHGYFDVGGR